MKSHRHSAASAALCVVMGAVLAPPALAQDAGDDWDLREDAARKLTLASLEYEGAPALAVRCLDGELAVIVANLPPQPAGSRFELSVSGRSVSAWRNLPDGRAAYSSAPAISARDLMRGGEVVIDVAQENAPLRRYRLAAPTGSAAVRQVMEACGRPTLDPRDDLRRLDSTDVTWVTRFIPEYPQTAQSNGVRLGEVLVSCIVSQAGAFDDCRVESETPPGNGFGQSAVRARDQARVTAAADAGDISGALYIGLIRFQLEQ